MYFYYVFNIRKEKDLLLETRVLMKKEIDFSKQQVLDKFDKVKKGKVYYLYIF